jgi:DnaJ-class molecular chaperone
MSNYYEILGVDKTASSDEIKKAYRKLAAIHHPDRAGGDTAKFQELQAAYDTLSNPEKRQQYDQAGQQKSGHNVHPDDFFRNFGFGQFTDIHDFFHQVHRAQNQPRKNRDLKIKIAINLAETLEETEKTISVKTTQNTRDTVVVKIPPGITAGSVIKYPGLGDNFFESLPRGDLYVYIDILQHQDFQVQGLDLETTIKINCFEAIIGCEKQLKNLEGKLISVKIPSGTQPGSVLLLRNQGLIKHGTTERGAIRARVQVEIPQAISDEHLEIIKQLNQERQS